MKKVLIVHYSQTGQLSSLAQHFAAPLQTAGIQVDCVSIVPAQAFPFPWPFWRFFRYLSGNRPFKTRSDSAAAHSI